MSDSEHCKFVDAFQIFKEQTDFENEQGLLMLKYYVQMAYLEGWKNGIKNGMVGSPQVSPDELNQSR